VTVSRRSPSMSASAWWVSRECDDLQRQLAAAFQAQRPPDDGPMPAASPEPGSAGDDRRSRRRRLARWEWPIEDLLSDTGWWDRWLPRLYELLSRDLRYENEYGGPAGEPIVDSRGYGDLLTYLFPPARGVAWRSPDYPRTAAEEEGQDERAPSVRAQVWNPVLRHVAKALRALEETSSASTDPQLRLEAEARITGSWVLGPGPRQPGGPPANGTSPPPNPVTTDSGVRAVRRWRLGASMLTRPPSPTAAA
jgi:hypothetical protein